MTIKNSFNDGDFLESSSLRSTQFSAPLSRRTKIDMSIAGYDATDLIQLNLLNFTYTDNISGKADDIQLTLHDRDGIWNGSHGSHGEQTSQNSKNSQTSQVSQSSQISWTPQMGMEIVAFIIAENWFGQGQHYKLPCGAFKIDEVEFSGPPDTITIKAVSASLASGFRDTAKKRAFENTSLEVIAKQIATENGLALYYDGGRHYFTRQDQCSESDLSFLNRLAQNHGMFLKVHDNKIVLTSIENLEQNAPVMNVLRHGNLDFSTLKGDANANSYNFKMRSADTAYTHAEVTYTDPIKGETLTAIVEADTASQNQGQDPSQRNKALLLDTRVESLDEAISVAKSALQSRNAKGTTANLELMGNPNLVAGLTVNLSEFGDFSGQYLIDKAVHTITASGHATSIELHKINLALQTIMSKSVAVANNDGYVPRVETALEAKRRKAFEKVYEKIKEANENNEDEELAKLTDILLCTPAIARATSEKERLNENDNDADGWLYLAFFLEYWFSLEVDPTQSKEERKKEVEARFFGVSWDWIMKFARARDTHVRFTASLSPISTLRERHIINEDAKLQIARILAREEEKYLNKVKYDAEIKSGKSTKTEFELITKDYKKWENNYHTSRTVERSLLTADGLMAALGSFTLRALANGTIEPMQLDKEEAKRLNNAGWRAYTLCVSAVSLFAHDKFNFAKNDILSDQLGFWSCEERDFFPTTDDASDRMLTFIPELVQYCIVNSRTNAIPDFIRKILAPADTYYWLHNDDYRNFRDKYGYGGDFLITSNLYSFDDFLATFNHEVRKYSFIYKNGKCKSYDGSKTNLKNGDK